MFTKDKVLWAKSSVAREIFWPAKVIEPDPSLVGRKQNVIACVEFLGQHTAEAINDKNKVLPYNCEQKCKFLQKGRALKNSTQRLEFDSAVSQAEKQIQVNEDLERDLESKHSARTDESQVIPHIDSLNDQKARPSPGGMKGKGGQNNVTIETDSIKKGLKRSRQNSLKEMNELKNPPQISEGQLTPIAKKKRVWVSMSAEMKAQKEAQDLSNGKWTPMVINDKVPMSVQSDSKINVKSTPRCTRSHSEQKRKPLTNSIYNTRRKSATCEQLVKKFEAVSGAKQLQNTRSTNTKPLITEHHKKRLKRKTNNGNNTLQEKQKESFNGNNICLTKIKALSEDAINLKGDRLLIKNEEENELENKNQDNSICTSTSDDDDEVFPEAFSPSGNERGFQKGDVVWAKYPRVKAPYWPAQIRYVSKQNKKIRYYCFFLALEGLTKNLKVPKSNIYSFTCDLGKMEKFKSQDIADYEKDTFEQALKLAEDILVRKASKKENNVNVSYEEDEDGYSPNSSDSEETPTSLPTNDNSANRKVEELVVDEETEEDDENQTNPKYNGIMTDFHCCKNTLLDIFHGKVPSFRHRKFHGSVADKNSLKHRSGFGPIQDDDIREQIIERLKLWYGEVKESFIQVDYIFDVWLPEAIIFFIKKYENVVTEEAEAIFSDHERNVPKRVKDGIRSWFKTRRLDENVRNETLDRARTTFQLNS